MNEEKEDVEEADAHITEDQMEQIKLLQGELKRLKGKKLVKDEIEKLNNQIKELERSKQPKNKVLKTWVNGIERFIKWWNMENLTPEEREAKRKRFSQATNNLFDGDNGEMGEIPPLFDDIGGGSGPPIGFLDEMQTKTARKPRSQPKKGGKQRKNGGSKQKRSRYVIIDGVAYPKADKAAMAERTKKKQRKTQEESDEDEQPFFDIFG